MRRTSYESGLAAPSNRRCVQFAAPPDQTAQGQQQRGESSCPGVQVDDPPSRTRKRASTLPAEAHFTSSAPPPPVTTKETAEPKPPEPLLCLAVEVVGCTGLWEKGQTAPFVRLTQGAAVVDTERSRDAVTPNVSTRRTRAWHARGATPPAHVASQAFCWRLLLRPSRHLCVS